MNDTLSEPSTRDQVLAAFVRELETASDRDAAVADYAARHPALADEFAELARVQTVMQSAYPPVDVPPPRQLGSGDRLGEFTVVRRIAAGGMGEVYEARQERLGRTVALKVIRRGRVSPDARRRFDREQRVLAKLHQTHIVPIHTAGEAGDVQYFAMAYIGGAALNRVVDTVYDRETTSGGGHASSLGEMATTCPASTTAPARPPRNAGKCVRLSAKYFGSVADIVAQAAEAVQYAHDAGVPHRDIKPSNLMVDPAGHCWIIDFGLAGLLTSDDEPTTAAAATDGITHEPTTAAAAADGITRGPMGTPQYMAPEQYDGKPAFASDVWGLGATLYELLTLRRAFDGTAKEVFDGTAKEAIEARVRTATPPAVRKLATGAPRDLAAICVKAMAKDAGNRYATPGELAADLRRWTRWEPTKARPGWGTLRPLRLWAWRRKAWAVTAAAVLIALVAGGGIAAERAQERQRQLVDLQKQQDRERAVVKSQQIRLGERTGGWSPKGMKLLEEANAIRPGDDLRDQAAATLVGLDATRVYEHPIPYPPQSGNRGVGRVVFSPDGSRVLAAGWSTPTEKGIDLSPALLWDGNIANKPSASTRPGGGPVAFPDADSPLQLVHPSGAIGKSMTLWNVGTNTAVLDVPLPEPGFVGAAALSPDARFAAASFVPNSKDGKPGESVTLLWAIDRTAATVKKLAEWPGASTVLAFSPDGQVLATGSNAGEVIVRSTADGKLVLQFAEGALPVTALGIGKNYRRSSDDRAAPVGPAAKWLLAVGSQGGDLSVWDLRAAMPSRMNRFYGSEHDIKAVAFSPDGSTLASAGRNYAFLWDVATGQPLLRTLNATGGLSRTWTEGVAFSPDGRRVAFGSPAMEGIGPGGLDVYRLDEDRGIRTYRGLTGVIEKTWLSPSGRWVAALSQNWQLGVWDRATGAVAFVWDVPAGWTADNSAVAFDENDTQVLFASGERVTRWKLTSGERTGSWQVPLGLNDSLVTRPGKNPILIRRDRVNGVLAVRARELGPEGKLTEVYTLADLDARAVSNTFQSPDGRVLLVNVNKDGIRPRLFDGLSGKPLPFDESALPPNPSGGQLSDSGLVMTVTGAVDGKAKTHVYRLPDLKKLGVQLGSLYWIDDAAKLGVTTALNSHSETGVALHRVGEEQPVVTFDIGRSPGGNAYGISPDGRFVYWGRRDGTVCVADVNKCLEQLAPFGPK